MNALAGIDFTLMPGTGTLDIAGARPSGDVVPFYRMEGRMAVTARMGRESLKLILDSGATHIILFRTPAAMAKSPAIRAVFGTLEGARLAVPTCWTADMAFTSGLRFGTLPAAIVARPGTHVDGLVPASLFRKIYVDQARGEAVFVQ